MKKKEKMDFQYIIKDDYDKKLKINNEELKAYSKKKLKSVNSGKDYVIFGETFEERKLDKENDFGRIELNEKRLFVGESGKHSKLFKKQGAFVEVEGGFIALIKKRVLPIILIIAILVAGIGAGTYVVLKELGVIDSGEEIDPNIKPVDTEILTISGYVTKSAKGLENITLTLEQGTKEVAKATTDKDGKYLFSDVKNGNYNLVCKSGESILTKIATVDSASISVNFRFPANDLSDVGEITEHDDPSDLPIVKPTDHDSDVKAIVKTDEKTPNIAIGGLDKEAMLHMIAGKEVDVTLTAIKIDEEVVPQEDKAAISSISGDLKLTYFDLSVLKEVFRDKVLEETTKIIKTKTVLEVAISHDSSRAIGTYVFRNHEGESLRLEELDKKPTKNFKDGTYFVTADTIYIYTDSFSTYAVGSAYTDHVVRGKDTISYSDVAKVNLNTKKISMFYEHDKESTNDAKVEILLVGESGNLLIAESGIIPTGYKIETMNLLSGIKNMPSVGTYNGIMRITYLGIEGAQTSTQIEIPLSVAITK